jgi:hypothetical protein
MERQATDRPDTLAEVIDRLGHVPLDRVWAVPYPGSATELDLIAAERWERGKLLELVDGILVEKAVTTAGAVIGAHLVMLLGNHIKDQDAGVLLGATCPFLLRPGLVRKTNVAFVPWERIPGGRIDMDEFFARFAPALIVELMTDTTPQAEIDRKLSEFFAAGTRLAWVIAPRGQSARMYTEPGVYRRVTKAGSLDASAVLPGLKIPMSELSSCLSSRRKRTG